MSAPADGLSPSALHAAFLAIAPRIERHGRIHFRGLKHGDALEEAIAEMVALSWKWFLRLAARGKDPSRFPSAIAAYAARAVWSGRRLCGQEKSTDALSAPVRRRHGITVRSLPACSTLRGSRLESALADSTVSAVDEQVAFRMDFNHWLSTHSGRDRGIVMDLMAGANTAEVANKHGFSPQRISQKRVHLHAHWRLFQDGPRSARNR
jgi:hypothetical protein